MIDFTTTNMKKDPPRKLKKIIQRDAQILREISTEVSFGEIQSQRIKNIICEMKDALASQDDGVALAAPQIGYNLRIFVVSHRFIPRQKKKTISQSEVKEGSDIVEKDLCFINPVLLKLSREKKEMEEGCLSVRFLYGKVTRSQKATVVAYDEEGKKFSYGASGLMAQVFQHETDHLNGILFIDKATHLEEVSLEQREEKKTHHA